jgi:general secretion pathway protein D
LRDVDAMVALDAMTKANGLFYRQDRASGIIRIYTTDEYESDIGSFREEKTQVFTLLYPNPVDVAIAIQSLFGDGCSSPRRASRGRRVTSRLATTVQLPFAHSGP